MQQGTLLLFLLGLLLLVIIVFAITSRRMPRGITNSTIKPAPAAAVLAAQTDLARNQHVTVDKIAIIESRAVDWPDTSLGCPQPGVAYAQVITPGYFVRLELSGREFEYHTDESTTVAETIVVDCTGHPNSIPGLLRSSQ